MAAWWDMQCEDVHQWTVFRLDDNEPTAEQLVCPEEGHPAITASRCPLADRVEVRIIPAAWERDGKVGREAEFFFELHSTVNAEKWVRAPQVISWESAVKCGEMFLGISWAQVPRRWKNLRRTLDPSEQVTFR